MKKAFKETLCIMLRFLLWLWVYLSAKFLIISSFRTFVIEAPWHFVMGALLSLAVLSVLMLAAQLLLVWVRAEKKEENES